MLNPFKTKKDYKISLLRSYELMQKNLKNGTAESDELEVLFILVEAYEKKHYPIPPPHPVEAIRFRLEQSGMSEKELNKLLGGRNRKSEIMSGKRKLSLNMIPTLHEKLHIPAETLIAVY